MRRLSVLFIGVAIVLVVSQTQAANMIPAGNISIDQSSNLNGGTLATFTIDGNISTQWLNAGNSEYEPGGDDTPWISFAFDKVYTLDYLVIWNLATHNENGQGMRFVDIQVSLTGDADSFTSIGVKEFPIAGPGLYSIDPDDPHQIDLGGVDAKAIKLVVLQNWFGRVFWQGTSFGANEYPYQTCVGLNEIQFHQSVPEPATMSLLALGGLALLRRKR